MLPDVVGGGETIRIARHDLIVLWLVDADIVDAHGSWQIFGDFFKINGRKTVRHSKVGDDGHWLFGDLSCAEVAVGTSGFLVHSPGLVFSNIPCNEAVFARLVLERVGLVLLAIVPVVVQVGQARDGLLVRSALVSVHGRDSGIVNLHVFCLLLVRKQV